MHKVIYATLVMLLAAHTLAAETDRHLAQDLVLLFGQNYSSAGQSLAFLQKYAFDYKNEQMNWGKNGNAIRYLDSATPIYVFNQGQSIVGIAGQLPTQWLQQLQQLPTVRCQSQPFQQLSYICRHQSATNGTLEHFQYRIRGLTAPPKVS